ncbi:hypothetical protein [Ekhidna sp.]
MKLKPTMFYDPEPIVAPGVCTQEMYDEWKARQAKPEEPKSAYADNSRLIWIKREALQIGKPEELEAWDNYFKKLDLYEENRLRYEGFERQEDGLIYLNPELPWNQLLSIAFDNTLQLAIIYNYNDEGDELTLYNGVCPSVSLFEQICSENNIELKKI